ncbi:WLM-domain-containing protein, partial [Nadsonia fulvescens var. elongata DSM 6958]
HDTTLVKTINALKRRENPKYALELLEKMASLVAPIMRAHKMKVGVLTEFCPKNPNLLGLNVNHGMKICVRLRPAGGERGFYPLEFCLGTLLHELTHNFYGPHDDKFYKFLDSLKNEYYTLVASGFTGEGFNSKGHILGSRGNNSNYHNLTQAEVRLKALKAAQNRKTSFSTPIHSTNLSGRKLGTFNNSSLAGKIKSKNSLKTLIREAAERRAADAKWC